MTTLTNINIKNQLNIVDQSLNIIMPFYTNNYEYYSIYNLGSYTVTPNGSISSLNSILVGAGGNGYTGNISTISQGTLELYGGAGGGSGGILYNTYNLNVGNTINIIIGNNMTNRNSRLTYNSNTIIATGGQDAFSYIPNQGAGIGGINGINGQNSNDIVYVTSNQQNTIPNLLRDYSSIQCNGGLGGNINNHNLEGININLFGDGGNGGIAFFGQTYKVIKGGYFPSGIAKYSAPGNNGANGSVLLYMPKKVFNLTLTNSSNPVQLLSSTYLTTYIIINIQLPTSNLTDGLKFTIVKIDNNIPLINVLGDVISNGIIFNNTYKIISTIFNVNFEYSSSLGKWFTY